MTHVSELFYCRCRDKLAISMINGISMANEVGKVKEPRALAKQALIDLGLDESQMFDCLAKMDELINKNEKAKASFNADPYKMATVCGKEYCKKNGITTVENGDIPAGIEKADLDDIKPEATDETTVGDDSPKGDSPSAPKPVDGKDARSEEPSTGTKKNNGFQVSYASGSRVLRFLADGGKIYLISAKGSKLHKFGLAEVQLDFDSLREGSDLTFKINITKSKEANWVPFNSHAPIDDIQYTHITDEELNEAIDREGKFRESDEPIPTASTKPTEEEKPSEEPAAADGEEPVEADVEKPDAADVDTPESEEDAEPEDPETPDEIDKAKETELDKLAAQYKVIADCIRQRFRNAPEDGEQVAATLNKILNGAGVSAEKWKTYITEKAKKGTDRAIIQNKIIPTIANACGVDVPRQVNDDLRDTLKDRNGKKVGSIVVPEGYNQAPIELGDQVMSMDFGYPTINFNSELIRQILHTDPASNPKQLKKLLKALMERVNGSPAGQALIKEFIFSFSLTKTTSGVKRSEMYKLIKKAATAEGIPMLRRPLKVASEELVGKSEAKTVKVVPLNAIAKEEPATESIDWLEYDPLFEGWFSEKVLGRNKSEDTQKTFGNEIELPSLYLKQFYTILVPSGPTGLHNYARYMTDEDRASIAERLGDETIEEIKTANHNVNDMVLQKFVEANDGVPPFYILKPRTKPTKERLRVCDETNVNGKVCIKSIDGKNKAAYFMDKDIIKSVFEAG